MSYECKILADSLSPAGVRLTTMQITFPRFVLAEFNTHADLRRNSASSRAIPVEKRVASVRANPFVPAAFAANKRGMQAGDDLDDYCQDHARREWMEAGRDACQRAMNLHGNNVHKQWANRLVELWSWHTVIVTATNWRNFFGQRCSPQAQPEMRTIAEMMRDTYYNNTPTPIDLGEWHLPLVHDVDGAEIVSNWDVQTAAEVSSARCARVSYLTHEGKRDMVADVGLAEKLSQDVHMSPFEHPCRPAEDRDVWEQLERIGVPTRGLEPGDVDLRKFKFGAYRGWVSLRWTMPNEAVFGGGEP